MKYIKYLFVILPLFIFISPKTAAAISPDSFSTEPFQKEKLETIRSNLAFETIKTEPSKKEPIDRFDVDEDGSFVLGFGSHNTKTVAVYSSDGIFQYGIKFQNYGSFGVELRQNRLFIYLVRSAVATEVSPQGEPLSILKIQDTEKNNSYWRHVLSTKRKIGNTEYILTNDAGIFNFLSISYSKLVRINENGQESILYQASSINKLRSLFVFVGILLFICIVALVVIKQFFNHQSHNPTNNQSANQGTVL